MYAIIRVWCNCPIIDDLLIDWNECRDFPCGFHAQCQDTIGSYTCTCIGGFTGTGFGDCRSKILLIYALCNTVFGVYTFQLVSR